jgi:hypothetical protein
LSVAVEFVVSRVSRRAGGKSRTIDRTIVREGDAQDEQTFASVLADVARLLWSTKTAANIAAAAKCSERAAQFYLSGQRDWSADAMAAVILEVLKRHLARE